MTVSPRKRSEQTGEPILFPTGKPEEIRCSQEGAK